MLKRNDFGTRSIALCVPVAPCELEARFHRLAAAIAEKRARKPRQFGKPCRQLSLQWMEVKVRGVDKRRCLLGNGGSEPWVCVPQRSNPDAGYQVGVLQAVVVVQMNAAAAREHDRHAFVGL